MQRPNMLAIILSSMCFTAHAHIVLENPMPFQPQGPGGEPVYGLLNPIKPDGSDFPCKVPRGGKLIPRSDPTRMTIGEPQLLSWLGEENMPPATHGGGSCQVALTTDQQPTQATKWMVVHSIEGGCPVRTATGNLPVGVPIDTFNFSIPVGIAPGSYVLSWSWVNRIGGTPEYYQNCAPVQVNAAKSARSMAARRVNHVPGKRAEFPDLFKANIGEAGDGCVTAEAHAKQMAIAYPDAGASVEQPRGADDLLKMTCGGGDSLVAASQSGIISAQRINGPEQTGDGIPDYSALAQSPKHSGLVRASASFTSNEPAATVVSVLPPSGSEYMSSPIFGPSDHSNPQPTTTKQSGTTETIASSASRDTATVVVLPPQSGTQYESPPVIDHSDVPSIKTSPGPEPTEPKPEVSGNAGDGNDSSGVPSGDRASCTDGNIKCIEGTALSICTGGVWTSAQPLNWNQRCQSGEDGSGFLVEWGSKRGGKWWLNGKKPEVTWRASV